MPDRAVDSNAVGTNDGTSWANAYTTLAAATAASTNADTIFVAPAHLEAPASGITVTCPTTPGLRILGAANTSAFPPTSLVTAATAIVGPGATTASMNITGCAYIFGIHIRNGTTSSSSNVINFGVALSIEHTLTFDTCIIQYRGPNTGKRVYLGPVGNSTGRNTTIRMENTEINASAGTVFKVGIGQGTFVFDNVTFTGAAWEVNPFEHTNATNPDIRILNSDLSQFAFTSLFEVGAFSSIHALIAGCKIPASLTLSDGAWPAAAAGSSLMMIDCSNGDTHGLFRYETPTGTLVSDSGIYFTEGAAAQSWKIVTTAACSPTNPFETPYFGFYNSTLSAVTPYFEILRNLSATAFQNDEVWAEILGKTTNASTRSTAYNDHMVLLGTPANQAAGAGLGSWTGEDATAWSGKCGLNSSITPAENGHISGRIVVGEPSITVYVDPQIRT